MCSAAEICDSIEEWMRGHNRALLAQLNTIKMCSIIVTVTISSPPTITPILIMKVLMNNTCAHAHTTQSNPPVFCASQCASDLRTIFDECGYTGTQNGVEFSKFRPSTIIDNNCQ